VNIIAIDPGTTHSAWVLYSPEDRRILNYAYRENGEVVDALAKCNGDDATMVIEMVANYGMPSGAEIFETCIWIGKFEAAWKGRRDRIFRATVKTHLCGTPRAKDPNVRQALLDRWGGKLAALGTAKSPGPLKGITGDLWSSLAIAVVYADIKGKELAAA